MGWKDFTNFYQILTIDPVAAMDANIQSKDQTMPGQELPRTATAIKSLTRFYKKSGFTN